MIQFACVGLDHRHIYDMTEGLLAAGAECVGYFTRDDAEPLGGFIRRFPQVPRFESLETLYQRKDVSLIVCAGIPGERAEICIQAMRHGKDVMVDKPGIITQQQLRKVIQVRKETGSRYSISFSEHFQVPAVLKAKELIEQGAIGKVIQTVGLGPHRHNPHRRRPWFYEKAQYGGILIDIASHQIDQFLFLTGSADAEIAASSVGNYANPNLPEFEDYGEIVLRSPTANGFIRVDWYTPDALPTWGDGRLFIQGTEGYLELRKYIDILGEEGKDHLMLVNQDRYERIDCSSVTITYFEQFLQDIRDRTELTMTHDHCFTVCRLALEAQEKALVLC